jgi:CubicO group peptidase (beta-lactamase class C family)
MSIELIQCISELKPVAKTASRPVYPNIGFFLFAHALQLAAGKNYTTLLQEVITGPFGRTDRKESPGDDSNAVIPPIEKLWGRTTCRKYPGSIRVIHI